MIAYHFVGKTLRDGSPIPPDGEWLEFAGEPILCEQGLHASKCPFDALKYAPGATLCLVELGGTIIEGNDKVVATRRKIIKRVDLTDTLRYFARMQAVSVLHLWDECPPDVVLDYLMTGDESLRDATWAAAWAASAAARAAVRAAARAAGDAVWAAGDAAWAARDAASAAVRAASAAVRAASAAVRAARRDFRQLVNEALEMA